MVKVLGPALVTRQQQKQLEEGVLLEIQASAVFPEAAKRATLGDLFWVREPYVEFVTRDGYLFDLARGFGPLAKRNNPKRPLPSHAAGGQTVSDFKMHQYDGEFLPRESSWNTLEIVGALCSGGGWRCEVHVQQVDSYRAKAGAA